jgi:tRNA G18 (ribose-2'-O)-methylase SpoU
VSILCEEGRVGEWETKLPPGAKLLVLSPHEIDSLLGYAFHRGVLCCCAVPDPPSEDALLSARRLLVLPRIDNLDNLGQLARTAAALGMDAILLGGGPDPFSRRCVRVSMGAVWKMPIYRRDGRAGANDAVEALDAWLRFGGGASEIVGTADAPGAVPLREWRPAPRTALVLGPEDSGLDAPWREKCDRHVRIPMARQVDSLNVAAAGAVLMAWMAGSG